MFEGGGALGPIMDMAKSMFNMPIDSQMINEKLGLHFTTIIRNSDNVMEDSRFCADFRDL